MKAVSETEILVVESEFGKLTVISGEVLLKMQLRHHGVVTVKDAETEEEFLVAILGDGSIGRWV